MRRISALILAIWAICGTAAMAEPRIALVVGNSTYESVSTLDNPGNDARLLAEALTALEFQVTLLTDASLVEFRQAIASFGRDLRAAGPEATGLFYYAGHGLQSFQSNYLRPVDAHLTDAADIDLVAIQADAVLRQMSSARNRTNIVILDACRNNPFENLRAFDSAGLAEMKAPTGTFLAYATEPGMVALDGTGNNSPFTAALVKAMPTPGMPIEQVFKSVRVTVLEATGGMQTPWDSSSLTTDFQFARSTPQTAEDQLWEGVKASRDPVQIMLYIRAYPDGAHFDEARRLLAEVMEFDLAGNPAERPRAAVPAPAVPTPADPVPVPQPVPTPAPEPAAAPQPPAMAERDAFNAAQAAGKVEDWEAFLAAWPDSAFREIAEAELAAARDKSGHDPQVNPPGQGEDGSGPLTLDIFFDQPLAEGGSIVMGKSLAELIAGTPLYPPFQGLPEDMWKGQSCANCHQWTQAALCDQGSFYARNNIDDGIGPLHPYGGQMRRVLRVWAEQGCR